MAEILNKQDTYGVLLAAIQFSEVNEDFRILADLIYLLDEKTFKRFLSLYEGQTIKIPTRQQFTEMLRILLFHAYTTTEGLTREEAFKKLNISKTNQKSFLRVYRTFKEAAYQGYIQTGGYLRDFQSESTQIKW